MTGIDERRGLVVEIETEFAAPPDQVFVRWTDPAALSRWFAPPGYTTVRAAGRWQMTHQHVSFPVDAAGQASSQR